MVRFQVFDAITGEETAEEKVPRDIWSLINGVQKRVGSPYPSRAGVRPPPVPGFDPGFNPPTAAAAGPAAPGLDAYGRRNISSVNYGPYDSPVPKGDNYLQGIAGNAGGVLDFLAGDLGGEGKPQFPTLDLTEEQKKANLKKMAERLGLLGLDATPTVYDSDYEYGPDKSARLDAEQAEIDAEQAERDATFAGDVLYNDYRAGVEESRLAKVSSDGKRNIFGSEDQRTVGDSDQWSPSQKAFDKEWSALGSDDRPGSGSGSLQRVWEEMQEIDGFLSGFGTTPQEIIQGILVFGDQAAQGAAEAAEMAARPGATDQVVEMARNAKKRSDYLKDIAGNRLRRYRELLKTDEGRLLSEVEGLGVDLFEDDTGEELGSEDLYKEAMLAIRAVDDGNLSNLGDLFTSEGQAQAFDRLAEVEIISTNSDGEIEISHELTESPEEAGAALAYHFLTRSLDSTFSNEAIQSLSQDGALVSLDLYEGEYVIPFNLGELKPVEGRETEFFQSLGELFMQITNENFDPNADSPGQDWFSQQTRETRTAVAREVYLALSTTLDPNLGFVSPVDSAGSVQNG